MAYYGHPPLYDLTEGSYMMERLIEGKTFCTVGQAAKILNVAPATVRRLCRQGTLECKVDKLSNYFYIEKHSVIRLHEDRWKDLTTIER